MTQPTQPGIGLVLDCADPEKLAEFWAPALGYVSLGTFGSYVALFPDGRPGPKLLLQRVEEPKSVKNRMHFDIEVPDIEAEADRLVALGATKVSEAPCSEQRLDVAAHDRPRGQRVLRVRRRPIGRLLMSVRSRRAPSLLRHTTEQGGNWRTTPVNIFAAQSPFLGEAAAQ